MKRLFECVIFVVVCCFVVVVVVVFFFNLGPLSAIALTKPNYVDLSLRGRLKGKRKIENPRRDNKSWLRRLLELAGEYIEDITRWREDMNFIFEWQEHYLTSERSERVRYCSCHENLKFISSSHRVIFFLLYGD